MDEQVFMQINHSALSLLRQACSLYREAAGTNSTGQDSHSRDLSESARVLRHEADRLFECESPTWHCVLTLKSRKVGHSLRFWCKGSPTRANVLFWAAKVCRRYTYMGDSDVYGVFDTRHAEGQGLWSWDILLRGDSCVPYFGPQESKKRISGECWDVV